MEFNQIARTNYFQVLDKDVKPWQKDYLAMYSTQWGGYTTDPSLMSVPVDDHLVHRGDGVFDVMRCVEGRIYQMEPHLARLEKSAASVFLPLPPDYESIREIIKLLTVRGEVRDCVIRVMLGRGPGSFSPNPFDCPKSHMYVVVLRYREPPAGYLEHGVKILTSRVPSKQPYYAAIKSCNYLPNVLMKMEAVQAGCEFAVALDEEDCLTEGATENIGVVSKEGVLQFPGFDRTLAGTTVARAHALGEALVDQGLIAGVEFARITLDEAYAAREVMMLGTSIDILPVVKFDGRTIGEGRPGPVAAGLLELLSKDMRENREYLTELDWKDGE
ncbi:MAG: aminotransferase class IV [Desulfobacteraceae bacterium]